MCGDRLNLNINEIQQFIDLGFGFEEQNEVQVPGCLQFESPVSIKRTSVGHNVAIGAYSYIVSGFCEDVQIGRYCSIGEQVSIGRKSKNVNFMATSPFFFGTQVVTGFKKPEHLKTLSKLESYNRGHIEDEEKRHQSEITKIGNDVWIGHNVFIKPGVVIGNGAVIGAHSVVTKDVPPYAIAVGSPAKVIRFRFAVNVCAELENSAWWDFDLGYLSDLDINLEDVPSNLVVLENQDKKRRPYSLTNLGLIHTMTSSGDFHSESPNARIVADKLFTERKFDEAKLYYNASLALLEPDLHYTLANYSLLELYKNDFKAAMELILRALSLPGTDLEYCQTTLRQMIRPLLANLKRHDLNEFLEKTGFHFNVQTNLTTLIIGFPRCGSTALFEKLLEEGATSGPVSESIYLRPSIVETIDNYVDCLQIVENSNCDEKLEIVDKSTAFSLSLPLLREISQRYSDLRIISLVRDPVQRSLSAFKMDISNQKNLVETLRFEAQLILDFGGFNEIFYNYDKFYNFTFEMEVAGIRHLVLYPTFIMLSRKEVFLEYSDLIEEFVISDFNTKPVNVSTHRVISEDEIEILESYLQGIEKFQ